MSNVNRARKSTDSRTSRAAPADGREDRSVSDDDRLDAYRNAMHQSALPDLPKIDGYHCCWLTTQNPRDPVHRRLRLGYELIKPEELGGAHYETLKTGEWSGAIGVNEMIAAKIPLRLHLKFMAHSHSELPFQQEQSLKQRAAALAKQAEKLGGSVQKGNGIAELADEDSEPPEAEFID